MMLVIVYSCLKIQKYHYHGDQKYEQNIQGCIEQSLITMIRWQYVGLSLLTLTAGKNK